MYEWETGMLLKHYLEQGVSKAELSRRFRVNRRTIHNWVTTGQLDHGRIETRRAAVCHEIAWLREDHDWPGLAAIRKIEATRKTARQTTTETRYYIMSATLSPERFQHAVCAHWAIENCPHWVLDGGPPTKPQRIRTRKPPHAATPRPKHRRPRTDKGRHVWQAQARRVERRLPTQLDPRRCMTNPKAIVLPLCCPTFTETDICDLLQRSGQRSRLR